MQDGKADTFTQADGLSGNIACSLFEDREGNIWFASERGLDRFRKLPVVTILDAAGSVQRCHEVRAGIRGWQRLVGDQRWRDPMEGWNTCHLPEKQRASGSRGAVSVSGLCRSHLGEHERRPCIFPGRQIRQRSMVCPAMKSSRSRGTRQAASGCRETRVFPVSKRTIRREPSVVCAWTPATGQGRDR